MNPMDGILAFLLLSSTIYLQTVHSCEIYRFVASNGPLALDGHVIKTITKSIVNLCWAECVWLPWCFSLNVRQTSGGMFECELNNSSKRATPNKMVTRQGWTYHEMKNVSEANQKLYELKWKEDLGNGWRRYGNSAFKLFQEKKNWTEARSHCQSLGGDLASITSSHENDFLYEVSVEKLNLTYVDHGISLPYSYVHWKLNGEEPFVQLLGPPGDASYKFIDGEKALYLNGKKGCAQMPALPLNPDKFAIGFWVKISASTTERYGNVLGIFNNSNPNHRIVAFSVDTKNKWMKLKVKDQSLGYFSYTPNVWQYFSMSWIKTAGQVWFGMKGFWQKPFVVPSPLSITNNDTILLGIFPVSKLASHFALHAHIKHLMFVMTSIGSHALQHLMYHHEQGVWIGMTNTGNGNNNICGWSDGTPVQFKSTMPVYWKFYNPNVSGRQCIAMAKERKWLDKRCMLEYPFICKKPAPP